jgi:hypothetical protein
MAAVFHPALAVPVFGLQQVPQPTVHEPHHTPCRRPDDQAALPTRGMRVMRHVARHIRVRGKVADPLGIALQGVFCRLVGAPLARCPAIALFASAIARVLSFAGVSSCDHDGERADSAPAVAPSNSV